MIDIEIVDLNSKKQVDAFVQFQYDLYKGVPQFCPPFFNDIRLMLNKKKHPFYNHSDGEFYVAKRDGKIVGRLGVMVNNPFNEYHKVKKGQFYLFECINDQEVANQLFEKGFEWCRKRGLNEVVGPKGLAAFDGYGMLVEGFQYRQMMTMMNYNFDYYPTLLENIGFEKEVDFVSCYMKSENFSIPEKAREIAKRLESRGTFKILHFKNKRAMMNDWSEKIGIAYNETFVNNWEYYPLAKDEVQLLVDNLFVVADPKLIKVITCNDEIAGFLLAFPDITEALQRHNGKINPISIIDMMLELKKKKAVSVNGAGVLPQYIGRGGNALLYNEMEKTIKEYGFVDAEFTQVAETAVQMRKDLISLGGQPYKNHRVFHKKI